MQIIPRSSVISHHCFFNTFSLGYSRFPCQMRVHVFLDIPQLDLVYFDVPTHMSLHTKFQLDVWLFFLCKITKIFFLHNKNLQWPVDRHFMTCLEMGLSPKLFCSNVVVTFITICGTVIEKFRCLRTWYFDEICIVAKWRFSGFH